MIQKRTPRRLSYLAQSGRWIAQEGKSKKVKGKSEERPPVVFFTFAFYPLPFNFCL
ncbi:MAG TPA: hypothetical protein VF666_07795 [Pyrinomonadaceae bacterium]|jgi:hypothetical protein